MKNGKKIVPRGDPILHGNHAKIDPQKAIVSDYEFYSVTCPDRLAGQARLPIASEASVELAKNEVDKNHK